MAETPADTKNTNRAIYFMALVVFIDMMGVSIIIPVMPELIISLTSVTLGEAASIGGFLFAAYAVMQFLFAPILGALSDRFGRRPVLLVALAGLAVDYLLMATAPTIVWLFVGRILAGILGATWPVANACVADVSTDETRARNFGIVAAAAGIGFVFGPVLGGLLGSVGLRAPFYAAAAMVFIAAAVGLFLLPETLTGKLKRRFDWARANPVGGLVKIGEHRIVLGVLLAFFLMQFAWMSFSVVWPYYTIEQFGWEELEIGISVALYGLLLAIVQGGLTGPVTNRFGNVPVGVFSIVMGIVIYFTYGFITEGWMAYALIVISAPTAFAGPIMQTLMTQRVSDDQQGELQGVIASVMSINAIAAPFVMSQTFRIFTQENASLYLPGAPFVLSGFLIVATLFVFIAVTRDEASVRAA
ncbi:MAG: TCR/Tet family MFS transporter [Pseudomonadota bacterium]